MAKCPLCNRRSAKRRCPAKKADICAICCGEKREIEIDCPSDCVHLRQGRAYEAGRAEARPVLADRFSGEFLHKAGPCIVELADAILEERGRHREMVDRDVRLALAALEATLKTLDAGIYYETTPEGGPIPKALHRRLKAAIEAMRAPSADRQSPLRVSEARDLIAFMIATLDLHAGDRPRSRRYLDWLESLAPPKPKAPESGLILP